MYYLEQCFFFFISATPRSRADWLCLFENSLNDKIGETRVDFLSIYLLLKKIMPYWPVVYARTQLFLFSDCMNNPFQKKEKFGF